MYYKQCNINVSTFIGIPVYVKIVYPQTLACLAYLKKTTKKYLFAFLLTLSDAGFFFRVSGSTSIIIISGPHDSSMLHRDSFFCCCWSRSALWRVASGNGAIGAMHRVGQPVSISNLEMDGQGLGQAADTVQTRSTMFN